MAGEGICEIVGKTIERVIVKRRKHDGIRPAMQVFLIFSDGTFYELYSSEGIGLPKGLDRGGREEVLKYLSDVMDVKCECFLDESGNLVNI